MAGLRCHLHEDGHAGICNEVSMVATLPLQIHPGSSAALARPVRDLYLRRTSVVLLCSNTWGISLGRHWRSTSGFLVDSEPRMQSLWGTTGTACRSGLAFTGCRQSLPAVLGGSPAKASTTSVPGQQYGVLHAQPSCLLWQNALTPPRLTPLPKGC